MRLHVIFFFFLILNFYVLSNETVMAIYTKISCGNWEPESPITSQRLQRTVINMMVSILIGFLAFRLRDPHP